MIKAILNFFAKLNIVIGLILMSVPILFLIVINTPQIWYRINPGAIEAEVRALTSNPFSETLASQLQPTQYLIEQPQQASDTTNTVRIPKIGVNTQILTGSNEYALLNKGVWKMPKYGSPDNNEQPIILAAHRWGPLGISPEYRARNMFINLPQLEAGDEIDVTWKGVEYKYRVYKKVSSKVVAELSDLILITCEYYNAEQRIIIYATKVN